MRAYYNEFDPKAAQWLRNLIAAGLIPAGDVDERSIEDVTPNDLRGYVQCHFFAGIGGWPLALALAGWPASRPVWTGSCPCQPFSAAGKGAGFADERHLWPAWQHLIAQCRPPVIFGEQVASKAVDTWIDLVHADLEGMGYAFGGIAFPAAGVGAPHIRDRTYWVADTWGGRLEAIEQRRALARAECGEGSAGDPSAAALIHHGSTGWLADANGDRQPARGLPVRPGRQDEAEAVQPGTGTHGCGGLADASCAGSLPSALAGVRRGKSGPRTWDGQPQRPGATGRLADANGRHAGAERQQRGGEQRQQPQDGGTGGVADAASSGRREEHAHAGRGRLRDSAQGIAAGLVHGGGDCWMAHAAGEHGPRTLQEPCGESSARSKGVQVGGRDDACCQSAAGPTNGQWAAADWLGCTDGKWRPVEPGAFPLAHGIPGRVVRLRAYGNAIVPAQAAQFIAAFLESELFL